jgi:serine/threonine protein kinase
MIGQTISHYRILEKLGEGGMGILYKAEDTKLKRIVALKFLPPDITKNIEAKERFMHEAQAASALNHPNICNIHTIEEVEGQQFIDMEFVEGETLKESIVIGLPANLSAKVLQSRTSAGVPQNGAQAGHLSLEKCLSIAIQIGEGLNAAHKKNIIHRDIKPDNIMITDEGLVKIMDFGLAKLKGTSKLTKTHSTLGTLPYMSPEQVRGEEVDQRTDIFSFGAVLYEMITSHRPFGGEHEAAIIYSLANETPEPLARYKTNVPDELQRIVDKALSKDRGERYQHVDDMISDLRRVQHTISGGIPSPIKKSKVQWIVVAIVLILVAVGIYLFYPKSVPTPMSSKSVAVLPFKNLSDSKEDEYFSDGITDDIIAQLSKISDLKVISRTSVMQYKGISKNIRDIGKELDVATVLEGSVRRSGNQIRIVAQLIDAHNEGHLWADTYDKEMTQIFAIQSDV